MKNIQKSHWAHIGSIWSILSSSVHTVLISLFGPIQSILSIKVLFSSILSYSVHVSPIWSIQSILALFGLYLCYSVYFSPFFLLQSISVLFGPFGPLWSYSVHFYSIRSILSTLVQSVHSVQLGPVRSILFLFGPPCSYLVHSVIFYPFGPL